MLIIKKRRLQKGWSQAELAHFSGLSVRTVQRVERGAKPGLETLKALAAVFDLDIADFQQEEESMNNNDVSIEEKKAFEYVQNVKGFYSHLAVYILVIIGLFVINLTTAPGYIWAKWPAIGWGIGILSHGLSAFNIISLFGPDWEKKQVEKRLGRKL